MMCGIIAYAVAIEEALAHPDEPLPMVGRVALAANLTLFTAGMGMAVWRATGRVLLSRLVLIVVIADVHPLVTLSIAVVGIGSIVMVEHRTPTEHEVVAEASS
jgi:hypothetical protein